ncbi:MAG TPA: hypothetical protein VFK57_04635 [Vicinamibacterales bacterium]|nr:hypothetical protein [Vicinamibacterales bacterium]
MLVVLGCLTCAAPAGAQAPEPGGSAGHGDVYAVTGWQNLRLDRTGDFDRPDHNWVHAILFGGAGGGWYWTDHLKTQVDVGVGTPAHQYRYRSRTINGSPTSEISRVRITRPSVSLSQQYQFFRNQWFHPRLGIGIDIARETRTEHYDPIWGFDPVSRVTRELAPARKEGPEHSTVVRPFGELGFKAYMTRRAFFTGDMRLMVRGGIDQALFRAGFGVDF